MSTALTTPAATTGPEARERSGHDDGDTGARRRQRPRVLDRPGARAVVGLA
ncbi:ABC transporter permease, partial [Micrococcus sp. HSID17228]